MFNKNNNQNNKPDSTIIDLNKLDGADIDFDSLLENGDKTIHGISTSGDLLLIAECSNPHNTVKTLYKKKFDCLKVIFKWWSEGNLSSVINAIKSMKDKIIMNDFFIFAFLRNDISTLPFTLEILIEVMLMAIRLSEDKYETYIKTGLETNYIILKIFKNKLYKEYITNNKGKPEFDDKIKKIKDLTQEIQRLEIIKKVKEKRYNEEICNITMKLVLVVEEVLNIL